MYLPAKIFELGHKDVAIWLQTEMGFVGEVDGDYESYCLYPSDAKLWPESDKAEVNRCWPIIKANNFKFIGAPQDTSSNAPKQFDGYLNGITTEIKSAHFSVNTQDRLYSKVCRKMAEMSKQNAEQGLLIFTADSNVTFALFAEIIHRLPNTMKQYKILKRIIIAFEKEKSILSFER